MLARTSRLYAARIAALLVIAAGPMPPGISQARPDAPPWPGSPKVTYSVRLEDRSGHVCRVEMSIDGISHPYLDLALPAWNNLYQLRDFVRNLRSLSASAPGGEALAVRQTGSHTWRIATGGVTSLKVAYQVFADQPGDFYSQIDEAHAFLNGANIFLYLPAHREAPVGVEFLGLPAGWKIGTALPAAGAGRFRAEDYDHLIDCPVEISAFDELAFKLRGVDFRVVCHGRRGLADPKALESTIRTVVGAAFDLMRDVPLKDYVFIYHFTGLERGGGMEHRNSTAINVPPARNSKSDARDPVGIAGVTAHEFFHLWNVKRIRPEQYVEPDHTRPFPTRALWFSEGVTSYYGNVILLRSGLITREEFYARIAGRITALAGRPARLVQSAEEGSEGAWRYPEPAYLLPENSIDYYGKGALLAFLADLKMRAGSGGARSLDDVMRFMNRYFAKRGVGFRFQDLQWIFGAVAEADFSDFFSRYVSGTEELPWRECLEPAGLELVESVATVADLGFFGSRNHDEPAVVARVDRGSPAEMAGLEVGDVLVSDYTAGKPDEPITLRVERRGKPREISFRTGRKEVRSYHIREMAGAGARQRAVLDAFAAGRP